MEGGEAHMQTVFGLFESYDQANEAVIALGNAEYTKKDISILGKEEALKREYKTEGAEESSSTARGAGGGAVAGGIIGLLGGLGAFAVPGIGPIVGVGALANVLASTAVGAGIGAAAGGIIGALMDMGAPEEQARTYEQGVKEGRILIAVKTADQNTLAVEQIMHSYGAHDVHTYTVPERAHA
jgi:uncharacterized membrane protein